MHFFQQLLIKLFNQEVGCDEFGNTYFESKTGKRFVVYKGIAEPSKIPAEWHGWIHYSSNVAPTNINTKKHSWQKIHLPNLTGTQYAYSPKNFKNSSIAKERKPYESWQPK